MKPCVCEEGKIPSGFVRRTIQAKHEPLNPRPGWHTAHDCTYVRDRNACIPEAERIADAAVAQLQGGILSTDQEWSRAFMAAMDDLSRALWAS